MTYIKELSEISLSRMSGLRWTDIVEIIILAFVLYYVLVWIKNTKAWSVLKGFFVIVAFILIAAYFEMNTIIWIVQNTFGVVATAVVVILQPELRKAIDELGRKNILTSILPFEVGRSSPEGRFSDKTINEIAKACVELAWNVLAVDPGPFTMKLAHHRGIIGEERAAVNIAAEGSADNHAAGPKKEKIALMIVGSANPATKRQIERLCEVNKRVVCISASPEKLIDKGLEADGEVSRIVRKAMGFAEAEKKPEAIVVETALHGSVINLEEEDSRRGLTKGTCSMRINEGLACITEGILEYAGQDQIAGLLLTGGDTMESVCRKIGVACIQAMDNIVAQVDVGKIIGKYDGLPVIVKGGFCGYEDVAVDIVDRLHIEASR